MYHFFPRFGRDAALRSPLADQLRRSAVPHRLFAEHLNRHYATRAGLLLRVYPLLFCCAVRAAIRSLVLGRPLPDAVVITSDIEAVVFAVFRALFARKASIVFETFIATERGTRWSRLLHHWHYSLVLRCVDVAVCHSAVEAQDYATRFAWSRTRFESLPYALSVDRRAELRRRGAEAAASDLIVTAGRSGRDYATLVRAIQGLPCRLRIVCDWERPVQGIAEDAQVTILRDCFRADYLAQLAQARLVVVPLSQRNCSAGQMVLLQAAALGKPVIITDTATTREYVTDGVDAVLTPFGDAGTLRGHIVALLDDPAVSSAIGQRASDRYDAHFSTEAYVGKLVALLDRITRPGLPGRVPSVREVL